MKGACKVFLVFYQLVRSYWKIICFQFKIHLQFIDFQLQCIYFINQLVFLFQSIESETSVKFKMYSKLILFSFNGTKSREIILVFCSLKYIVILKECT